MKKKLPYATICISAICVFVFLMQMLAGYANDTEGMILFGAYYKPFILAGEWWRFLTVGFVHASVWHLMINIMSLYSLGMALEEGLGRWKFLTILLCSVIGGSAFLFACQGNTIAVGLSAGLYGLIAAYIILIYRMGGMRIPRIRNALMSTIVINLLINFMPGVSWIAHLGGAVTGAVLTGILVKDPVNEKKKQPYWFAAAALVLCLGYLSYQNAYIPSNQIYILSDYHILSAEKNVLPSSYINGMAKKLDNIYGSGSVLQDALVQKEA
ncbi:MAG: rhomboid family intramembrane serine protease [Solobacterium sp.]|jgi:rhomboid protease GluP|nr:rhomboid family intramembrane serine protease [Solobacterium sp.]MCH4205077.1 rhomboid family intramembrane serine protease [Solobacterium sp.]MCH4226586.1 rhomboid family intramembrane serine protease [Solobacterium sp.]MCH4281870.1 rhomboid family intramembrane serine protease [Solobacterium sp.]